MDRIESSFVSFGPDNAAVSPEPVRTYNTKLDRVLGGPGIPTGAITGEVLGGQCHSEE